MNKFIINRFKSLSLPEIPYRINQLIKKKLEQWNILKTPKWNSFYKSEKILDPLILEMDTANKFFIFNKEFNYSTSINWDLDVFSKKTFPKIFSKTINIRKRDDLSAKVVWEVNRLQFLTQIAIQFRNTHDENILNQFTSIIRSWVTGNPYLQGINWYSNIEINIRLITFFLCWEILDADNLIVQNATFASFVNKVWLPSIYQHCVYSYNNPSKYSSSNNHLIAEYAGLFIASVKWRFNPSEKWISYAQKGLEKEIIRQHSENGVNKEEAAEYIQFITDFFLLSYIVAEKSHYPFSSEYKNMLQKIFHYIYEILDLNGNFPKYGDEDDGKCFMLDFEKDFNNFKSLLTSASILFNDPVLKSKSNGYDAKNAILFGLTGQKRYESITSTSPIANSSYYSEEGHFLIKKTDVNNNEIFIHFDAAPLGYLSIAAHGHADALSFLMNVDGQPYFVDPGTYTSHTEPEWRNYFVSTLAHNTIRINYENQATFAGSTLWLNHYKCNIISTVKSDCMNTIKASHNGYEKFGIIHTREISFDKIQNILTLTDWIESTEKDEYTLEIPFHLHPSINVNLDKNRFSLKKENGKKVDLLMDKQLEIYQVYGQREPELLGWYSKSFLEKEPSTTIVGFLKAKGDVKIETVITIEKS